MIGWYQHSWGDKPKKCYVPVVHTGCGDLDCDEGALDRLNEWRKEYARLEQELLAAKKLCGRERPDEARWLKDAAADARRYVKAAQIVADHIAGEPGSRETRKWPLEMTDHLDAALGAYAQHFHERDVIQHLIDRGRW